MKTITGVFFASLFLSNVSFAAPSNGDFSAHLASWQSDGVSVQGEEALLSDFEWHSYLYQLVALSTGEYTIEFDFLLGLSEYTPSQDPFSFLDMFFASVYFSNSPAFDLGNPPSVVLGLLDADALNTFAASGEISASQKGGNWLHYSASFTNAYAYVIPLFELADLNYEPGDSTVKVDNVSIRETAIPEPGSALLLSCGMFFIFRKKSRNS